SEVRLWVLGATSHMGNNNRWAREGGVIDEILVENLYRNPEGNPLIFDTVLLEKVLCEPNITLLLNTAVFKVLMRGRDAVRSVRAFCSQNSTLYEVEAPLFCDASGDGILGYLSGAAFRIGAEGSAEFGEKYAPKTPNTKCLGHTIFFYTKDTGKPVRFVPPAFALKDIRKKIPRFGQIESKRHGCYYWWIEYGGELDTVHESETIKDELWKVVYGVWNHIKNSGDYPEAKNLTLEWVGTIPGKRESRRFEGDLLLTQQDIVEQRKHADAVSFGGWAIDLHPVKGVYSKKPGCTQWHSKGVYQIPYRCLYSRNVSNLFLSGRCISVSHIAFGSTRVLATCAHNGQAVGMAAALCRESKLLPRELLAVERLRELQQRLLGTGHYIPGVALEDRLDLVREASLTATSSFTLGTFKPNATSLELESARAMLVPVLKGLMPVVTLWFDADKPAKVEVQLRTASREGNFTPDVILARKRVSVPAGDGQQGTVDFGVDISRDQYVFICLMPCPGVRIRLSDSRVTGVLSLVHGANRNVAKSAIQTPPAGIGVDTFEFWIPERRPSGKNMAISFNPPIAGFGPENVRNGISRPTTRSNAWVAAADDPAPALTIAWKKPQKIRRIELSFDTDFDHAMESVQWGHPEAAVPFCVKRYAICDAAGKMVATCEDNHQTRTVIRLPAAAVTDRLVIKGLESHGKVPPALFDVRCYAE
ncbi:MAG: FAD-dependent oxidoreductase, partial [bacterium]